MPWAAIRRSFVWRYSALAMLYWNPHRKNALDRALEPGRIRFLGERKSDMDISVISLHGEFDLAQRARLEEAFASLAGLAVVVDLTKALYVDSTVLACLVRLRRARIEQKGCVMLAGMEPPLTRIFHVSGLLEEFEHAATVVEALRSLVPGGPAIEHVILDGDEPL
jgi:anti-sigma B factor antagonist